MFRLDNFKLRILLLQYPSSGSTSFRIANLKSYILQRPLLSSSTLTAVADFFNVDTPLHCPAALEQNQDIIHAYISPRRSP